MKTKKLIHTPGYHITSKYDLKGLRKRRRDQKNNKVSNVILPLTPMIDMLSMLVIFLILNFSSGPTFHIKRDIALPEVPKGRPPLSKPVLVIHKNLVSLNPQSDLSQAINFNLTKGGQQPFVKKLKSMLSHFQKNSSPNQSFEIIIQADQSMPMKHIKKIMNILLSVNISNIHFAVRESQSSS